jgi:2'-5' RNA ligase
MNGIASLLDQPTTDHVKNLWQELESRCGLVAVQSTPFPHFSWQVTEGYNLPRLEETLRKLARQTRPFTVRTAGLGIFTGENPVVYVPIVKEESLLQFHALLWKQTEGIAILPAPYYAPDKWVPHITLAYNDVQRDNLNCALQTLVFKSFDWEIRIDNLVFVAQTDNQTTETIRYQFGT